MRALLWDFDGTLARREGLWTGALLELARVARPDLEITRDELRCHLRGGFPWHRPQEAHTDIVSADAWWQRLEPVFARAFAAVGMDAAQATGLAVRVRPVYCDPAGWRLFEDTLPTLELLAGRGWSHRILSNHVPELRGIVEALGLGRLIHRLHNSAESGYEKPHPEAFRAALRQVPEGSVVWMIGDNFSADVEGAERAGIPAVLVRRPHPGARRFSQDLARVPSLLPEG